MNRALIITALLISGCIGAEPESNIDYEIEYVDRDITEGTDYIESAEITIHEDGTVTTNVLATLDLTAPHVIQIGQTPRYMVVGREEWLPYREAVRCWANGTLCEPFGVRDGRPVWISGNKMDGVQWLRFEGFGVVEEVEVGE